MAHYQALLFDIGNVLLKFNFEPAYRAMGAHLQLTSLAVEQRIHPYKVALESGQCSDDTFIENCIQVLEFPGTESQFRQLWSDIFTPNNLMTELVPSLAQRYPLYLLSNTNGLHHDWFMQQYCFFKYFKGGVFSHSAKCMKPEPTIFQQVCHQFKLDPQHTLFIDDLAENIATAQQLGFKTWHYAWRQHHEQIQAYPLISPLP